MRSRLVFLALVSGILFGQNGPPSGYNVIAAAPAITLGPGQFGDDVDMVLDANGHPALTYLFYNPTGTGDLSTSALYFVRWNRAQAKWTTPVRIAVVGDNAAGGAAVASSMAYDPATDTFAVAYMVGQGRVDFASSTDGGQTWRTQILVSDPQDDLSGPVLAINGGRVYAAYLRNLDGVRFVSGALTAPTSSWNSQLIPSIAGAPRSPISLNIDKAGNAAVAFWMSPAIGFSSVLGFWRPAYASPIRVGDTAGVYNDFMGVSLAFSGSNPRLAVFADVDPTRTRSPSYATQSNDGGITWSSFAYLPSDTGQVQGGHISLAVGSKGQGAVVLERLRGNNIGQCGDPLLSRSADFLSWTTCTASGPNPPSVEAHDARVAFDPSDRIYLAFQNAKSGDLPIGVILWYEPSAPTAVSAAVPVAAVASGPEISAGGVVNAASFERSLAPGCIATIFGTNLSSASVNASLTPLPEKLGEVVVLVNGVAAPLLLVTATQINFQIPYETSPGMASVGVVTDGNAGKIVQVNIAPTAPGIFTNGGSGVIQNEDYSPNSPSSPAKGGSYVVIYATGGGRTDNAVPSGMATPGAPLSRSLQQVKVRIGNRESLVSFCGLTPGFAGLMQVNVQVPDLPAGTYTVQIISGSASSNQPNISIQ